MKSVLVFRKIDIPCLGHEDGNPSSGYDFTCDYEMSGEISCEDCVCTGGYYNPKTGKRIGFILRLIQSYRNSRIITVPKNDIEIKNDDFFTL